MFSFLWILLAKKDTWEAAKSTRVEMNGTGNSTGDSAGNASGNMQIGNSDQTNSGLPHAWV